MDRRAEMSLDRKPRAGKSIMAHEKPAGPKLRMCEIIHGSPEYWATAELRNVILRQPLGLQFTKEDIETETKYRHLACYRGDRLAACLMLRPREDGDVQMRQLAVAADMQRQGIGKALVEYSEAVARNAGYRRMILHAREPAIAFYEKLGYVGFGDRFEEVTVQHWAMEKSLTAG
jgi:ribosomal protein S18 acetylase RimI-like enzyme